MHANDFSNPLARRPRAAHTARVLIALAAAAAGCAALDDPNLGDSAFTLAGEGLAPEIDLGDYSGCAIELDGDLWCWGSNNHGQLGDGTVTNRSAPIPVTGIEGLVRVSAAIGHTCVIDDASQVWCWGSNAGGRLGDGTRINHHTPAPALVSDAYAIATGYDHSCAATGAGQVLCWGNNLHRQLGIGSTAVDQPTPTPVVGMSGAVAVSAGAYFSCAVRNDGAVLCWGENASGQLGDGTNATRNHAVQVVGVTDAIAVTTGTNHACALRADRTVQCWGSNVYGQLGIGQLTPATSNTPVDVVGLADIIELAAGPHYTCAVADSGQVACWGSNGSYQLGDGTTTTRPAPVTVNGVVDALHVSAGALHACASRTSGPEVSVVCWGNDAVGQLGDGGPMPAPASPTPVTVALP